MILDEMPNVKKVAFLSCQTQPPHPHISAARFQKFGGSFSFKAHRSVPVGAVVCHDIEDYTALAILRFCSYNLKEQIGTQQTNVRVNNIVVPARQLVRKRGVLLTAALFCCLSVSGVLQAHITAILFSCCVASTCSAFITTTGVLRCRDLAAFSDIWFRRNNSLAKVFAIHKIFIWVSARCNFFFHIGSTRVLIFASSSAFKTATTSRVTQLTPAQQGAAPDRLQLRSFLTPLSAAGELVVISLRVTLREPTGILMMK